MRPPPGPPPRARLTSHVQHSHPRPERKANKSTSGLRSPLANHFPVGTRAARGDSARTLRSSGREAATERAGTETWAPGSRGPRSCVPQGKAEAAGAPLTPACAGRDPTQGHSPARRPSPRGPGTQPRHPTRPPVRFQEGAMGAQGSGSRAGRRSCPARAAAALRAGFSGSGVQALGELRGSEEEGAQRPPFQPPWARREDMCPPTPCRPARPRGPSGHAGAEQRSPLSVWTARLGANRNLQGTQR